MERVALITGAGSGIGRATAELLAGAGYRLALAARNVGRLEETLARAGGQGGVFATDLERAEEAEGLVDRVLREYGRIDVLVNNAGWSPSATIPETTAETARRVFMLNAVAPCVLIARAWPALERQARAERRGGVIVNVSSMASVDPFPMLFAYGGAKAALNNLAISVAKQGQELGIRGFAVAPGAVETDLLRSIVSENLLPASHTLRAGDVARVILECVLGKRDAENGRTILLPSP